MDLVAGTKDLRLHKVTMMEEATVVLDEEDIGITQNTERTLIGKVMSDRPLNKGAVKGILFKAWGNPKGLTVADVGVNLFLFTFEEIVDARSVIYKGPWYVMNKIVSLQQWNPVMALKEIEFSKVFFWVNIKGLPLENMNDKSVRKLLSHVGEVAEIENPVVDGRLIRLFMRALVEVNIQVSLSTGCWVPRRDRPKIWVDFQYEKLHDLCFKCGVIGHEQKDCNKERVMSHTGKEGSKYGPRLRAPPARPLREILEE